MSTHAHDIQKEIRGYIIIGTSLLALTVITVAVSYLHLNITGAIIVALIIATLKASLVACYFMHLISEKFLIYAVLSLTVVLLSGLPLLTLYGNHDVIRGTKMGQVHIPHKAASTKQH